MVVGQFGRVHGVHGMIRVHTYMEDPTELLHYPAWYLLDTQGGGVIERMIEQDRPMHMLVKIRGHETRERAALLTHKKIGLPADQLPVLESGSFYYYELVGMRVANTHALELGEVTQVMATGANDVLVVQGERRHLIPYLPHRVIKTVCKQKRQIVVEWDGDFL